MNQKLRSATVAPATAVTSNRMSHPAMWIGIAAAALLVGYGDLWRGGHTLSALMLTVGYLVLVPAAIMVIPAVKQPR